MPRWQAWTSGALLVLTIVVVPVTLLVDGGDDGLYEQYPTVSGIAFATLLVAVPVLAGGLATASRGSTSGYVAWLGALGYMVSAWTAFATLFPSPSVLLGHTALVTLSLFTFIGAAVGTPVDAMRSSLEGRLPVVPLFGVLAISAALIAASWLVPLFTAIAEGGSIEPVLRDATAPQILVVLELGVLAPATAFVAHRLWTGRTWGVRSRRAAPRDDGWRWYRRTRERRSGVARWPTDRRGSGRGARRTDHSGDRLRRTGALQARPASRRWELGRAGAPD